MIDLMFDFWLDMGLYSVMSELIKAFMEEFFTNVTVENIHFADDDALRIVIEKNAVDFQMIP